ncbi:hypothetical protein EMIHUDRAFT_466315 [Emiliania huxleyi CCMP1516]|uniref:Uncharacterized protein n=2 Tax=Emiliania huxleyi TaxID=2903 RepID=A0A0D3HY05_EMIH1|nr:hypothetical protein EMIHUDRAFT_466315 [Emiliania huxleyi CCMP1516]EOD03890.1 hypothetical protein EMIHUDRAFT_466315 [Emiliania huxleyi CCMP1516]|eukprot:XP_005756319.1 hypothetical protein EMIHUDRAFT_466315 [Emiliania huxleyi CCMP1516]
MAPRSPPLPLHPPLHPPLQPPPRSPPCGLTRYDTTGAAWTYDFAPLAAAPLTADGERFSFRLALCGVAEAACRPAACVNASVCEPYDENLAQHGAAVAFVRGAVAPGPAGRGGCFEEGPQRSAAACTAPCSVLAPATLPAKKGGELQPHSSRWELSSTERQPHQPGWFRLPGPRRKPSSEPPPRINCTEGGRSTRRLTVLVECDAEAASGAGAVLLPPADESACEVRTRLACFSFRWRAGDWGACDPAAGVERRQARSIVARQRAVLQRQRLLAMTQSYQALSAVPSRGPRDGSDASPAAGDAAARFDTSAGGVSREGLVAAAQPSLAQPPAPDSADPGGVLS